MTSTELLEDAHSLVTSGETDRDRIAARLGVSVGTLERHLHRAQRAGDHRARAVLASTKAVRRVSS